MEIDIYYNPNYAKLYEKNENGKLEVYEYTSLYGHIVYLFLKRKIESQIVSDYYDIVSPYGYGGPLIIDTTDKKKLIDGFAEQFSAYCKTNRIVSEFIRFHPIYQNALDFASVYDVSYSRHTVGTNLKDYDDPVQAEFSKSLRKELRKAEEIGITSSVIKNPDNLEVFKKLYYETMKRNNAEQYYFFDDEYWNNIVNGFGEHVLEIQLYYCGDVIASELYFIQGRYMHAHLLGSNEKMLELNAGVMLEATAARWGHDNGYQYIHHGGGRTSAEDDSLYLYKSKYGKHTKFDFYIGKKIWLQDIYDILVEEKESKSDNKLKGDFFPQYREI